MRTLVIGDIHGGLKALKQIIIGAKITEQDNLIFLGDYVDGWSQSAQVIDYLIELSKTNSCIFIKGNHDTWLLEYLLNKNKPNIWLEHGGIETINSYKGYNEKTVQKHLLFLNMMKNYYVDSYNRLSIHAGFSSMHGPENEPYSSNYSWDRTLWETACAMDVKIEKHSSIYPKRLKLFHEIYIGHTPTQRINYEIPVKRVNVWNIDTGAGFTGRLSCLDIDTKEFWQSDALSELYPNEKGRN